MADIFLHDFAARTSRRVTTSPDYDEQPVWSPDGTEMLHTGNEAGQRTMMRVRLDGSTPPVELMRDAAGQGTPSAWSPDRKHVLFWKTGPGSGVDIMVFPIDDPRKITPLLIGPENEGPSAVFSPDARWIALAPTDPAATKYVVRFHGERSPPRSAVSRSRSRRTAESSIPQRMAPRRKGDRGWSLQRAGDGGIDRRARRIRVGGPASGTVSTAPESQVG